VSRLESLARPGCDAKQQHDTDTLVGRAGHRWASLACTLHAAHGLHGLGRGLLAIARAANVWLVAWVASRLPITPSRCPCALHALSAHSPRAQRTAPSRNARHPSIASPSLSAPSLAQTKPSSCRRHTRTKFQAAWTCFLAVWPACQVVPSLTVSPTLRDRTAGVDWPKAQDHVSTHLLHHDIILHPAALPCVANPQF
jgi:hypothetical protein